MSMIGNNPGKVYAPGWFLAHEDENAVRVTATIAHDHDLVATAGNGGKYVPAGAVIPSNDENAVGILYQDTDVTNGDAMGSIVTKGTVYASRLPEALDADAVTALTGITVIEAEPTTTRPY